MIKAYLSLRTSAHCQCEPLGHSGVWAQGRGGGIGSEWSPRIQPHFDYSLIRRLTDGVVILIC